MLLYGKNYRVSVRGFIIKVIEIAETEHIGQKEKIICDSAEKFEETIIQIIEPFQLHRETCLSRFAEKGYLSIVKHLVESGVDINYEDGSPLRFAVTACHFEIVKYLVKQGAHIAPKFVTSSPIMLAQRHGHSEIFEYLKKEYENKSSSER